MDKLEEIYNKITRLRKKKVPMKQMSQACNMYQSVFSAIYMTVIPHYLDNIRKGYEPEEAIEEALSWVNNVSKKKFITALDDINNALDTIKPPMQAKDYEGKSNPFLSSLFLNAKASSQLIGDYTGIYMSYSLSSMRDAMKAEPYILIKDGDYVRAGHKNIFNKMHWGCAIINEMNNLYIMFNELQNPQVALCTISIKLPHFVHTNFMRGIYMCMDYNDEPIARRIVFIKQPANADPELFDTLESHLIYPEQLTAEEQLYYNYTCRENDVIRMKNIENPQMSLEDLLLEK